MFILIQLFTLFFFFHRHSVRPNVWRGEGWSTWHWPSWRFPDESRQEQVPRATGSCVGPIPRCSWAWGPTTTLPWLVFCLNAILIRMEPVFTVCLGKQSWPLYREFVLHATPPCVLFLFFPSSLVCCPVWFNNYSLWLLFFCSLNAFLRGRLVKA